MLKYFQMILFEIVIKEKQQGEAGETGDLKKKNQPKRIVKKIIRTFWIRL